MNDLLVIGRGPSVFSFEGWGDYVDMMAVSSGIYAIPEEYRPPAHFVSMDFPKWFLHALHDSSNDHAWQANVDGWNFWKDERIAKHVPAAHNEPGIYRELPAELWDALPDKFLRPFQRELSGNLHLFGAQPGWGDYPNVVGWETTRETGPNFGGRVGMRSMSNGAQIRNSWFMAVQVAYRLGYRRLFFIGCDFRRPEYALTRDWAREYWAAAKAAGMEWYNLSPDSALDFLPSEATAIRWPEDPLLDLYERWAV
jgi:hypothetical protein